jgi:CheY-like chemotaxis protein
MKHILHVQPDLILLDLMMPDVSGLEVLRFLRREPQLDNLPVVIVSAKCLPEDIQKGMEAGASLYMTKPIAYRELIQSIGDLLADRS